MTRKANHRNKVKSRRRKVSKVSKGRNNTKRGYTKRVFIQRAGGPRTGQEEPSRSNDSLNLGPEHGFPKGHSVRRTLKQVLIPEYLRELTKNHIETASAYALEAHKTVLSMDQATLAIHKMAREHPIWIQNSDSPHCKLCGWETHGRGSSVFWRHHCRYCGWLVCDKCSPPLYKLISIPHTQLSSRHSLSDVEYPSILTDRWLDENDTAGGHQIQVGDINPISQSEVLVGVKEKRVCNLCYVFAPPEIQARLRSVGDKGGGGHRVRMWPQ
jgi:ribosomal protein L37AE/L43A